MLLSKPLYISSLSDHHNVTISPEHDVDRSSQLVLGHIHEHHYVSPSPKDGKVALTMQTSVFNLFLQTEFQVISKYVIKAA